MAAIPIVAVAALASVVQGGTDAVVINISPAMFFLTLAGMAAAIVIAAIKFTNYLTAWMTRVEDKVAEIPSLRDDRHTAREKIMVLESRADATDKWIAAQTDDERTLRVAVAEFINERRVGERRGGTA